mgnify:CR=1 FL=1
MSAQCPRHVGVLAGHGFSGEGFFNRRFSWIPSETCHPCDSPSTRVPVFVHPECSEGSRSWTETSQARSTPSRGRQRRPKRPCPLDGPTSLLHTEDRRGDCAVCRTDPVQLTLLTPHRICSELLGRFIFVVAAQTGFPCSVQMSQTAAGARHQRLPYRSTACPLQVDRYRGISTPIRH